MWSIFNRTKNTPQIFKTDLHSHLLPNLDDGVASFEKAEEIILVFQEIGFSKAITTPHIMSDAYRNTPEGISNKLDELKSYLISRSIDFEIQAAAEYYFDEAIVAKVNSDEPFLFFGDKYVLFETNTITEPYFLNDFIFKLKIKGYNPVMAHPERYEYLHNNLERIEDLIDRGVYMQVNSLSLAGHYSRPIRKTAEELVQNKLLHFLGSDCHTPQNARALKEAMRSSAFQKVFNLSLLNYTL